MKDTEKIHVLALALLLAAGLMLAGFGAGWSLRGRRHEVGGMKSDTILIERIDTVTLVEPKVDTLIRYVSRLYPVAVHDTTWVTRHTTDSIWVTLPYEHRYYAKPDTLEVWYSGVDPRIDSATVYMRHTTEIVRQPYEVARMPLLSLNVGVGAFYSPLPPSEMGTRVNPYLGAEMRWNAKKTTFSAFGAVDHTGRWAAGVGVSYRFDLVK